MFAKCLIPKDCRANSSSMEAPESSSRDQIEFWFLRPDARRWKYLVFESPSRYHFDLLFNCHVRRVWSRIFCLSDLRRVSWSSSFEERIPWQELVKSEALACSIVESAEFIYCPSCRVGNNNMLVIYLQLINLTVNDGHTQNQAFNIDWLTHV